MASHGERFQSVRNGCPPSLLDPMHFDAIIYGSCKERKDLELYRECSRLSIRDSRRKTFLGCNQNKKRECESKDILGRGRALSCRNRQGSESRSPSRSRSHSRSRGVR